MNWTLKSIPPHDFFLCLDIRSAFDHEHDPAEIPEKGFTRPVPLKERDILATIHFNGDPEKPEFHISCEEPLNDDEVEQANQALARILGTNLDLKPLYDQAKNDHVLSPLFEEFYGLKRLTRASFFEDAMNRIIQAQISHKPTARKMVYGVREAHGTRLEYSGGVISSWPRPSSLISADPVNLKQHGLSLRKGEYIVGLAHEIVSGNLDLNELENEHPLHFYNRITKIRGIGPTTAQDLMLFRGRPDGVFPSHIQKGEEKGLRKWIAYAYGEQAENLDEQEFKHLIRRWKGHESLALEHLYLNYIMDEKKRKYGKSKG